ncbi:MAG: hypothetical protein F6K03_11480, partial [Kamptonema sp. SIO4C4]|nr:hypothetical protein [Kamptonema sp. SIO4C4]
MRLQVIQQRGLWWGISGAAIAVSLIALVFENIPNFPHLNLLFFSATVI